LEVSKKSLEIGNVGVSDEFKKTMKMTGDLVKST